MTMHKDLHPQYITDASGHKLSVVLPVDEFEQILEDLEDLAVVAERRDEESISHEAFVEELKRDGIL